MMFEAVGAEASLQRIEEDVRRFWRLHAVAETASAQRRDGPPFLVAMQPTAAVGAPWARSVRLLCVADLLARYRAMRGHEVRRWAGWSCHGLAVELAVEQSLGAELARYDLADFNSACRQAALDGVRRAEVQAKWLGNWIGPTETHTTLEPTAVDAVWGLLRRLWEQERLKQELRTGPICPRCATPLSNSEAGRHSVEVETPVAWVCLPWLEEAGAYFLVSAPEPWKLTGMVALAAHPDIRYALVELKGQADQVPTRLLLAESRLDRELVGDYRVVRRLAGKALRGEKYSPAFTFVPSGRDTHQVILSRHVPLDQGTGLLPVTPAFDARSLALAQPSQALPSLLDDWGCFRDSISHWRGLTPLEAEPLLIAELEARGLLLRQRPELRKRPLCPYCGAALLSLSRSVWLAGTGGDRWVVGRDRAWGMPLPIWICNGCSDQVCVPSLEDLGRRTGLPVDLIDPHRPAVDRLTFPCARCSGTMFRVAPIVDSEFEEAALLSAALSPVHAESAGRPRHAEVLVGLEDRPDGLTRLAQVASLLPGSPALVQAPHPAGRALDLAWEATPSLIADAVRWAVYTGTTPGQAEQRLLRPLWALAATSVTSEMPLRRTPLSEAVQAGDHRSASLLDRWMLARLQQGSGQITAALEASDLVAASAALEALVEDLQWWSFLLSQGAYPILEVLSRLAAPFLPHLAEAIYQLEVGSLRSEQAHVSVHLADWPTGQPVPGDQDLIAQMAIVRRLAALGQHARSQISAEPENQPDLALIWPLSGRLPVGDMVPFLELLAEMLGLAEVRFTPDAVSQVLWQLVLTRSQAPQPEASPTPIESALLSLDSSTAYHLAVQLGEGYSASLESAGRAFTLLPGDVRIEVKAARGYAAAVDAGWLVVLGARSGDQSQHHSKA